MKSNGQNIINELAGNLSIDQNNIEQLQHIINEYPYFAFGQLLLAKNLTTSGNSMAEKQMQKTALYFSNPSWLRYLLASNTQTEEVLTQSFTGTDENSKTELFNQTASPLHAKTDTIDPPPYTAIEETEPVEINEVTGEESSDRREREKLSRLIEQHLSEFKKPVGEDEEIPFETRIYHTIDYFASQGIKLDAAQLSQDPMENKVKKFTDWLKQMKRTSPQPSDLGTDETTEHQVQVIAQTSNEIKEIVTEAMAEVLLKQGKKEKALELYQKLSFLNPAKSTYFAAKINELKGLQ